MNRSQFCDGISRRHVIQAGLGGLFGLSMPTLLRHQAEAASSIAKRSRKSVVFLELVGGPSHFETYDPKPHATAEYRGPFNAISTKRAGVQFSERMAKQAAVADKLAVIRSITHDSASHRTSAHLMQTGFYLRDRGAADNEMPSTGSIVAKTRGANAAGMPPYVTLPRNISFGKAGWLGAAFNAFETVGNPSKPGFKVPNVSLMKGLTPDRLADRRGLLEQFDSTLRVVDNHGASDALTDYERQAFEMVTDKAAREAFDIYQEDDPTRELYGRTRGGQNMLLARRLVERGVSFVTLRIGSWDHHGSIVKGFDAWGAAMDGAVAGFVQDIHDRGLQDDVLLVVTGEFGRTPRMNRSAGRDHWGKAMSILLSGGGLKMGQVIGSTDGNGTAPSENPYRPEHILSMIYRHVGIDPTATNLDHSGRPRYILETSGLIPELIS